MVFSVEVFFSFMLSQSIPAIANDVVCMKVMNKTR